MADISYRPIIGLFQQFLSGFCWPEPGYSQSLSSDRSFLTSQIQVRFLVLGMHGLLAKCRTTAPTEIELSALAAPLHSFYTGVENIFKRVAVELDGEPVRGVHVMAGDFYYSMVGLRWILADKSDVGRSVSRVLSRTSALGNAATGTGRLRFQFLGRISLY